jgi:hypothetical protein
MVFLASVWLWVHQVTTCLAILLREQVMIYEHDDDVCLVLLTFDKVFALIQISL